MHLYLPFCFERATYRQYTEEMLRLAKKLYDRGVKLYATPGTAAAIARLGVAVNFVAGLPKMLELLEPS